MCETAGEMYLSDMVVIDTIVFMIVASDSHPPPHPHLQGSEMLQIV